MSDDADKLLELITAVTDGRPVDWASLEAAAKTDADKQIIHKLRLVAAIDAAHRAEDSNVTASPASLMRARTRSDRHPAVRLALKRWGTLEVFERVGEGAFGEVYRAYDLGLQREVALKLLWPSTRPINDLRTKFLQEARSLASVKHPNVAAVYGLESHDGRLGMWLEFLRGLTLAQLLQAHGRFSASEASLIGIPLCDALTAVHSAGFLHRDVKAQNVMREEGGRIVLMDFGAAQVIGGATRSIGGTPLYIAPEVLRGTPATVTSDIYSLGVLLFKLVTDEYPCHGSSIDELQDAHAQGVRTRIADVRPDLPEAFIDSVERALSAVPDSRHQSARELRVDLLKVLRLFGAP